MKMAKGIKYYKNENEMITVVAKLWHDSEMMVDFYYNESFIGSTHTEAAWSNIFDSGDCTDYLISLLGKNKKLAALRSALPTMTFVKELMLFEHPSEEDDFLTKVYVTLNSNGRVTFSSYVCLYPLGGSKNTRCIGRSQMKVNSFKDIDDWCDQFHSMVKKSRDL